ncbi:MAG: thioredoxin-disulfide reductase [Huintestinicola sp.]
MSKIYDTIIIGGGPAGYTAALYGGRAGLDTLVIEKLGAGGQMTQTIMIDNYPGFAEGIDGITLGSKMQQGAERFGAATLTAEVLSVDLLSVPKKITTDRGELSARTVIIATGADHKRLGIKNENELIGKGVSYCAACDGMLYKGKTAAVVGGGNSAAADAVILSRICRKVYIIHRRETLRADRVYRESLMKTENVEFRWNSEVKELSGNERINSVIIENNNGSSEEIPIDGLFISIGRSPSTQLFKGQLALDELGYIKADETTRTSVEGVFAAGDVRTKAVRQVVTAAADGAAAVHFAEAFLAG